MSDRFIRIRPFTQIPEDAGRRLRVERPADDLTTIADEVTLPERVHRFDANQVRVKHALQLTRDEVRWLGETLCELEFPAIEQAIIERVAAWMDARRDEMPHDLARGLGSIVQELRSGAWRSS